MFIKTAVLTFFSLLPKIKLPILRFFRCHALYASGNKCNNCNLVFKEEEKLAVYYHVSLPGIFFIHSSHCLSLISLHFSEKHNQAKTKSVL